MHVGEYTSPMDPKNLRSANAREGMHPRRHDDQVTGWKMNHLPSLGWSFFFSRKSSGILHNGFGIIWWFPVPPKHPKMIIFSRKNPWLLGTTILGNTHIWTNMLSNWWVEATHRKKRQCDRQIGIDFPPSFGVKIPANIWNCPTI